ncbi:Histone acetyltransferase [Tolypocladium ophioglossoides CBS 100239]|uniref:histone acetyltransferase n=1 Tax=Tolypocladium ophioglossoides (strain CBS 100239) TaxID=1163406 RepID=A0A0L0MXV8_TOLOC|nr:Histone acetyltransferase [Tolypocladium ophioglossoides CBS 100239]
MATTTPDPRAGSSNSSLGPVLAAVLPRHHRLRFFHLSTPPLATDALYSAPPNERPDRTYCEKHLLAVSVDVPPSQSASPEAASSSGAKQVLVLGIEIFIYTTAHATTLFVSKADSTGFLHLLGLPKGTPSPIREVCAAFVGHLVEKRRRKDVQFVVSLFARAQDQYLFPGSVKYGGKHVLDDRGLVKWWCRVLDPLIVSPPTGDAAPWKRVKGYLVVPGLDAHETRAFIPRGSVSWSLSHPLEHISHYYREFDWVPPRCLIPRFPDDPKSRFRDELDEEAAKSGAMQTTGSWKSVRTLDLFWEMMSFRQECSSGRMTGFIWVVFDDEVDEDKPSLGTQVAAPLALETPKKQRMAPGVVPNTTPKKLFPSESDTADGSQQSGKNNKSKADKKKKKKLRGPIQPRQPRIKTEQRNYLLDRPTSSKHYYWPPQGRGERIVDEGDYKRIVELLLHLDFATLDKATGSTRRWVGEAGMGGRWGLEVTGTREPPSPAQNGKAAPGAGAPVNNLSGLVKRKRAETTENGAPAGHAGGSVNVLDTGLVRKKPKA